jgi:tight adherence protein C
MATLGLITAALLAAFSGGLAALSLAGAAAPVLAEAQGGASLPRAVLRRLAAALQPHVPAALTRRISTALVAAGEPRQLSPSDIVALEVLGALGGLVAGVAAASVGGTALLAALLVAGGALLPLLWLRDRLRDRQRSITRALPYALDLLTLSVEAGLDFAAGLAKVVERGRPGPLRDELALVQRQLRLGKTREEALRGLMERVDLPALSAFVRALIQADRMGTRLGGVLRVQSAQLRQERSLRAEKLASEAPVKMLFPLLVCIFPTVFLVLFGPIVFAFVFGGT